MQTNNALYPMGYFLSWRTYGTWLQGDARGWTTRDDGQQHPDPVIVALCRERMRFPALYLTDAQRRVVDAAVRETCAFRRWQLHLALVLASHVHVVVSAPRPPERVLGDLKAWATRHLREEFAVLRTRDVWSGHGSTEYLHTHAEMERVVGYILDDHHNPR